MRGAADSSGKFSSSIGFASAGMGKLSKDTKAISTNIAETTLQFIRWSGIAGGIGTALGGLAGLGGLYGLDRLGAGAAGMARAAGGLGVTPGEQQAFNIDFKPALDSPDALLGNIADAKNDLSKRWLFSSLGIRDPENRDAADLAPDVLAAARSVFKQNPTAQAAHARGLDQLVSMPDLRRIGGMSDAQFQGMNASFQKDRKGLDIDAGTLQEWQKFVSQMQRAGAEIEKVFITGLVPLAGPLKKLSEEFVDVVVAFLKAPELRAGIVALADDLKIVADWFKHGKFPWNDDSAVPIDKGDEDKHPTALGKWLYEHFDRLRAADAWLSGKTPAGTHTDPWTGQDADFNAWLKAGHSPPLMKYDDDAAQFAVDYFKGQGATEAGAIGMMSALGADSQLNPDAFNPDGGGRGAVGIAGWRGSRIDDFARLFGHPLYNWGTHKGAPLDEQLAFVQWELTHTEKAAGEIARNARDSSTAAGALVHAYERPGKDEDAESGRAVRAAHHFVHTLLPTNIKVDLNVKSSPGSNPTIAASQAAGG